MGVRGGQDAVAVAVGGERARRLVQRGEAARVLRDDGAHARPRDAVVQAGVARRRAGVHQPVARRAERGGPLSVALVARQADRLRPGHRRGA